MAVSHRTLVGYYKLLFALKRHHHWSIQEIESLVAFELDVYSDLTAEAVKEEKERAESMAPRP